MYISKKILIFLSLILSFVFGMVYATSSISAITGSVSKGDIITAEYYNNLNGTKDEGKMCKYSGGKLVCMDEDHKIKKYYVNFSDLQSLHSECSRTDAWACESAARRYCEFNLHYISGFANEINAGDDKALITCIK